MAENNFVYVPTTENPPNSEFGMIHIALAGGRIPVMAQWRAPGEWWTLGMANATKYEKGITHHLRPFSVSEVPDDKIIDERYTVGGLNYPSSAEFPHPNNFRRQGAKEMRDQLLPHFALLKEENEKLKARVAELEGKDFPKIHQIIIQRGKKEIVVTGSSREDCFQKKDILYPDWAIKHD